VEQGLGPWDLAAPWVIVEEAGGRITDFDGIRSLDRGEGLATNGLLHEAVLQALSASRDAHPEAPSPSRIDSSQDV